MAEQNVAGMDKHGIVVKNYNLVFSYKFQIIFYDFGI